MVTMAKTLPAVMLLGVTFSVSAFAQFSVNISIDELGNSDFTNTAGFNAALPFALQNDPGPGGLSSALTFDLLNPPGLTAGDLILLEPDGQGTISDIIRFNPAELGPGEGTGALVFYSDIGEGADALADIGFPTALYEGNITLTEIGPEGDNGFTYTPTSGQPGFVTGAAGPVTYTILSDGALAVPEPSTIALLLCAAGLFGIARFPRHEGFSLHTRVKLGEPGTHGCFSLPRHSANARAILSASEPVPSNEGMFDVTATAIPCSGSVNSDTAVRLKIMPSCPAARTGWPSTGIVLSSHPRP